jgi:hypothetical protein
MTADKLSGDIEALIRKALVRLLGSQLGLGDPTGAALEAVLRAAAGRGLDASGTALALEHRDLDQLIRAAALDYEGRNRFTP